MKQLTKPAGNQVWRRTVILGTALLFLLAAAATTDAQADEQKTMIPIEDLLSKQPRTRDRAVDAILRDREALIKQLIPLIDPANAQKYSDETRSAAAYLLGELRAVEAVPVLSQALADPPGPLIRTDISRYDSPVFTALVNIGRPAVPEMIKNIETTENKILRKRSMDVLNHVLGGKRRLLELLLKVNERNLNKQPPDREAALRIRQTHAYAEAHYKVEKEPLY